MMAFRRSSSVAPSWSFLAFRRHDPVGFQREFDAFVSDDRFLLGIDFGFHFHLMFVHPGRRALAGGSSASVVVLRDALRHGDKMCFDGDHANSQ
jgi:hypothetical protein